LYLGGEVLPSVSVRATDPMFSGAIQQMQRLNPDAALLLTNPAVGASIVQEWATLAAGRQPWYFSPTLEADAFPRNVPPDSIADLLGVSPALPDDAARFADAFAERWMGDVPLSA